jgi:hypothetical protein
VIRPFQPDDTALVVDSWLTSFRRAAWAGMLSGPEYRATYGKLVPRLIAHPDVSVLVSVDEATDLALGWAAFDTRRRIFHYVYVKAGYRDRAEEPSTVAIDLMRAHGLASGQFFAFTFRTQAWEQFYRRHRLNCRHKHHLVKLYENQGS